MNIKQIQKERPSAPEEPESESHLNWEAEKNLATYANQPARQSGESNSVQESPKEQQPLEEGKDLQMAIVGFSAKVNRMIEKILLNKRETLNEYKSMTGLQRHRFRTQLQRVIESKLLNQLNQSQAEKLFEELLKIQGSSTCAILRARLMKRDRKYCCYIGLFLILTIFVAVLAGPTLFSSNQTNHQSTNHPSNLQATPISGSHTTQTGRQTNSSLASQRHEIKVRIQRIEQQLDRIQQLFTIRINWVTVTCGTLAVIIIVFKILEYCVVNNLWIWRRQSISDEKGNQENPEEEEEQ